MILSSKGNAITITIRNRGDQPVTRSFWVDVYFDPDNTPQLNQPWQSIAPAGAAWGVTKNLAPGEVLTLTVGDAYYNTEQSSDSFPTGANVYGFVDSINYDTTYGNVKEGNEVNNLSDRVISTGGGQAIQTTDTGGAAIPASLPRRQQ
jgi:hypothetical protein